MIKDREAITVPELVENEDRRAAFRIPFVMGICKVCSHSRTAVSTFRKSLRAGDENQEVADFFAVRLAPA